MEFKVEYSYEFNLILNKQLTEKQQLENYSSLILDKDRFLMLTSFLSKNCAFIEKTCGFKFPKVIEFYVVRAEQFKSFSKPITIEYSICPEEMLLYLISEIIKVYCPIRFSCEQSRSELINTYIDFLTINGNWGKYKLVKFSKNLHEEAIKIFPTYSLKEVDFFKTNLKEKIEKEYKKTKK